MKYIIAAIIAMACIAGLGLKPDSKFISMDPDQFSQAIKDTANVQILDVRTAEEYGTCHIAGAINISVADGLFAQKAARQLQASKTVAVYCRSGRRSKLAAQTLESSGFSVIELDCGINCWISSGKEIFHISDKAVTSPSPTP